MSIPLKLISVNIERTKHLGLVVPFLQSQRPDVCCLQELAEKDIPLFEKTLAAQCVFAPMTRDLEGDKRITIGVGIFSAFPIISSTVQYYRGDPSHVPDFDKTTEETKSNTQNHPLIFCDIEKDNSIFRIGTTHFTWTDGGQASDTQREDIKKLLTTLDSSGDFVLVGDFNAPRGGEIFGMLAERYTDNIPLHYTTSIDGTLHRAGAIPFMVDGIFSTPQYHVSDVELISGVSDHCAIVGVVSKTG